MVLSDNFLLQFTLSATCVCLPLWILFISSYSTTAPTAVAVTTASAYTVIDAGKDDGDTEFGQFPCKQQVLLS